MTQNHPQTTGEIHQILETLGETYTDFVVHRILGTSHDNRPIPLLRIGLGMESIVLTGGIHGSEWINPVLLTMLAEEYCEAYSQNASIGPYPVRELLNRCSLIVIPLVNPDGYETARRGFSCIQNPILRQMCKMRGIRWQNWKYNARGIDINSNFPCKSYVCQQLGEYPGSEQETQALIRVFDEYDTIGYLDFHSRGRIICYYRQAMPFFYNHKNHKLARSMQRLSEYNIGKKEDACTGETSGGCAVNYYSQLLGKPAIMVETVEDSVENPMEMSCRERTYQEIRTMPLEIINKT